LLYPIAININQTERSAWRELNRIGHMLGRVVALLTANWFAFEGQPLAVRRNR
jgi:hypothetical protein